MTPENNSAKKSTDTVLVAPPRRKSTKRRWPLLVFVLAIAGGSYYYFTKDDAEPLDQPLIVTVAVGSIENTISSAGSLKPSIYVDVGAQVSGQLEKLYVEVGDTVEAGQLVAQIDARTQQSRVQASRSAIEALQAQITSRNATLTLARSNSERQQRLMSANATSQLDYDTAQSSLANAESSVIQLQKQIEQSQSSLSSEETQLEFARIYAPIAGTVVSIEMNEGRTLNANQQAPTILRVADLSTMTVETQISEADIGNLKKGMQIYFTTLSGGSRRWSGELRQILPTPVIESNVVLYTGLFDVENSDGTLLPEMTAQVFFITSAARDVLTVPIGALTFVEAPAGAEGAPFPVPGAAEGAARSATGAAAAIGQAPRQRPAGAMGRRNAMNGEMPARRFAVAKVVKPDGTQEERQVVIGITSRISAEVISGLKEGDQLVAGIIQSTPAAGADASNGIRPPGGFGGFR